MPKRRIYLLACASVVALAAPALAQTPSVASPAAPPAADTTTTATVRTHKSGVEDIVVTAQSRAQKLQRVPISINAFNADFIRQVGAQTVADLQQFTPGLSVDHSSTTQPNYNIRGVATSDFGVGTDPSVGLYVDGVYSARSGEALIFFNDLERVEVLKGPQGTLFGRNTAAGAIAIITKKPTDKFEGTIDYKIGNYDKQEGSLVLNVPVTDNFSVRMDGVINRRNGWLTNYNGASLNNEHNNSTRLAARWKPGTDNDILLSWDHDNTNVAAPTALGVGPYTPNGGDPFNGVYSRVIGGRESRTLDGLTLTAKHQFDGFSLTSLSAFKAFHTSNRESETGSIITDRYFDTENRETNHSYYQEFRANGVWRDLTYTAGASYFQERAKQASIATTLTDSADVAFGAPLFEIVGGETGYNLSGLPYQEQMRNLGQNKAWSVFGDATYALTPTINLTTGLRITGDDKDFQWNSPPGVVLGAPAIVSTTAQYLLNLVNNGNAIFNTYPVPQGTPINRQLSSTNASPRFVADYHFARDAMVYASASYGYIAGGFNSVQPNSTFQPETVDSYEIGVKSDWLDHRLRANITGFYYTYANQQSLTLAKVPGSLVPQYLVQVGDSEGKGIDFELHGTPVPDLVLGMVAGFIDTTWTKRLINGYDLAGQPTGEPELRLAVSADYSWDMADRGSLRLHATHSFTTAQRRNTNSIQQDVLNAQLVNLGKLPGYEGERNLSDMRLTWLSASGHYEAAAYVENLFDNRYVSGINRITADTLQTPYVRPENNPAFYGVELAYHF